MATVQEAVDSKKTADAKNEAPAPASNLTAASEASSNDLKAQSEAFAKTAKRLTIIENLIKILLKNRKTNDKTTEESYYKDAAKKLDIINDLLAFAALPNYGIVISTHIDKIQQIIIDSIKAKPNDSEHNAFCLSMHIRNGERWLEAIKKENRDSTASIIPIQGSEKVLQSSVMKEKAFKKLTGKDPRPIYGWLQQYSFELALILVRKKEYKDSKTLFNQAKTYLNSHSKNTSEIEEKFKIKFGGAEFSCQYAQEMHWEDLDLALKILEETQAFLAKLNTPQLVPNSERKNIEQLIDYVKNSTSIVKGKKLYKDLAVLHNRFLEYVKNPKNHRQEEEKAFKEFFKNYEPFLHKKDILDQYINHIYTWITTRNSSSQSYVKVDEPYNLAHVNNIIIYSLSRMLEISKKTDITDNQKSFLRNELYYCHMQCAIYYAETRDLNAAKASYVKAIDQQKILETIPSDPAVRATRLKFNHAGLLWFCADIARFIDLPLAEVCINEAQVCIDEFIKLFPAGNSHIDPEKFASLPKKITTLKKDIEQDIKTKLEEEKQSIEGDSIQRLASLAAARIAKSNTDLSSADILPQINMRKEGIQISVISNSELEEQESLSSSSQNAGMENWTTIQSSEQQKTERKEKLKKKKNKEKSLISNPAHSAEKPSPVHNQPQPAPVQTKAEPSIQCSSEPTSQPKPTPHPVQTAQPTALVQWKIKRREVSKKLKIRTVYLDRVQLEEQFSREKNLLSRLASTDEKEAAEKFSITVNSSPDALSQIQIQDVPSAPQGAVTGETITTIHRTAEQLEMQQDHKKIEESTQLVNPSLIAQQNPSSACIEQYPDNADVQLSSQNTTQLKSILQETKKKYGTEFFLTLMAFLNSRNEPTKKYSPHLILSLIDFLNSNNSDMARIQPDCSIQDIERGLNLFQINYYSLQLILDNIGSTAFSDMERAVCLSRLNFASVTLDQNRKNALDILYNRCLYLTYAPSFAPSLTPQEKELLGCVSNSMLKLQHFPSQYLKTIPEQNVVSIAPIPLLLSYPLTQPNHPALTGPSDSNTSSIKLLL